MKIDFSVEIKDLYGNPIYVGDGESRRLLTLMIASCDALLANFPDEPRLPVEEKLARYNLASRIVGSSVQELTIEEIATIKNLIAKSWGAMIVGKAYSLLDPESLKSAPKVTVPASPPAPARRARP